MIAAAIGAGSPLSTFLPAAYNGPFIIKKVIKEFKGRFPHLKDLSFIQFWPGLIDTTRDLLFSLANSWAKFYQVDAHRKPLEMKGEF